MFGLFFLFYAYQLCDAYQNISQIKILARSFEASIAERDVPGAQETLKAVMVNINELKGDINRTYPFTVIPPWNREARAAKATLAAAEIGGIVGGEILDWAGSVPVLSNGSVDSYGSLSDDDRLAILTAIQKSPRLWDRVASGLSIAETLLEQADESSRLPVIRRVVTPALATIREGIGYAKEVEPWIAALPSLLGTGEEKTYLLLLQNNTELRPTGGFIGTYGTLTVKNGSITDFRTDNVYNLDEPAKAYNEKIPPEPIQKYLKQSQWFFRDSNWDPDFPTSARQAMLFYADERGAIKKFNGVIAFTPDIIQDLLSVTGPISAGDTVFDDGNLVDILAYHVEVGFRQEGITIYNRKEIIDDLAQELKNKLFGLSAADIRSFSKKMFTSLDERQVMMYFTDPEAQRIVADRAWDGRIPETNGDYLFYVDANLGSLKSDPAIERTLSYTLTPKEDGSALATASMTYAHTGDFDWKTTRYRTYARVYVPRGSKLVSVSGNEEPVVIRDEHGKTMFGTFISVEPKTEETLSFSYTIPQSLIDSLSDEDYTLLIQKQGGTSPHRLILDIAVPFKINAVTPKDILQKRSTDRVSGEWRLSQDRSITLTR